MSNSYNRPARPWDLFNPTVEKLSEEVVESRLSICKECPEFVKVTSQCKKCGCIMNLKAKLSNADCPMGKWAKLENVK
jgi:hypothetical protein